MMPLRIDNRISPGVGDDLTVKVTVDEGVYQLAATDPVKMRYRINTGGGAGGAWTTVVMSPGIAGDWFATLPGSSQAGDVIDFYIRVEAEDAAQNLFFTCFPLQAQFDFSAGAGPEERDFFSVVVTEQAKTVALSTDLESAPNWTSSTQDPNAQKVWQHGGPAFEEFDEQPAFDFPYDVDGSIPGTGPYCFYTFGYIDGQNMHQKSVDPAGTSWTLTTDAFDLSNTDLDGAVVSYALWFYVRNGRESDDKFTVEFYNGSSWATIQTIEVAADRTALQRWLRQRVKIPNFSPGTGRKLRFSAVRHLLSGGAVMEAAVDEVRVWGVHND